MTRADVRPDFTVIMHFDDSLQRSIITFIRLVNFQSLFATKPNWGRGLSGL